MLAHEIKKRVTQAMKDKNTIEKDILRLVLGEIQTAEARGATTATDDEAFAIVRKLIKSNQETLAATTDDEAKRVLAKEIEILGTLLPASLSIEQIVAALSPVADAIKAATNDGQATGVAMKHLKPTGLAVSGKDVSAAVKQIRG